jgi:hypothetical protein
MANTILYNGHFQVPLWAIEILNTALDGDADGFINAAFLDMDKRLQTRDFSNKIKQMLEYSREHGFICPKTTHAYGDIGQFATCSKTFKVKNTNYKFKISCIIFVQEHRVVVTHMSGRIPDLGNMEKIHLTKLLNRSTLKFLEDQVLGL